MKLGSRRVLFGILFCTFVIQTVLVYIDDTGYRTPRLSDRAKAGWKLWHDNNCQSCHQIYGFGGFLGPDLTNAIQHLAEERLQSILTEGLTPMPAFHFSPSEIAEITRFLSEVDATGTGQFAFASPQLADEVLHQIVEEIGSQRPLTVHEVAGFQLINEGKCIGCHLPNLQSTKRAPDLCDVIVSPGADGIAATLLNGRVGRGMPQFDMDEGEQQTVISFLRWMHDHRIAIRSKFLKLSVQAAENARIPWFEYSE